MNVDQFWSRVDKSGDCWVWTGSTWLGYGKLDSKGPALTPSGTRLAHRISYELLVGPIPEGLHLDHLCRVTACLRPDHLEPVTPAENTRRGLHGVLRTHCRNGHELSPENTSFRERDGSRRCRRCIADDQARRRAVPQSELPEFCKYGHRMTGSNLKPDGARLTCRECARKAAREYAARKRAAVRAEISLAQSAGAA